MFPISLVSLCLLIDVLYSLETFPEEPYKYIAKCCSETKIILISDLEIYCNETNKSFNFLNASLYDEETHEIVDKTLGDIFLINITGGNLEHYDTPSYILSDIYEFTLSSSGRLILELPNHYNRWEYHDDFCIDYYTILDENEASAYALGYMFKSNTNEDIDENPYLVHRVAMVLSCVVLVLVLGVYCLLPNLRTLKGMILMAYLFSFLCVNILILSLNADLNLSTCLFLSIAIYFFALTTFCWTNVMSFDMWWTFRGIRKARTIHRRGIDCKFLIYVIYSWGLPLLMTIGLVVIDNTNLRHIPWFVKPNLHDRCFFDGKSRLLYLHFPAMIILICNFIFFCLTIINICSMSRNPNVLCTSTARNTNMKRFYTYLKISVIMGLNWSLDVLSMLYPQYTDVWNVTDLFNILISVVIFIMFVCKKSVYNDFMKRYVNSNNKEKRTSVTHALTDVR